MLFRLLVNSESEVDPTADILGHIFRLKGFSHDPDEVVLVHGPLRQKHGVELVIHFFVVLHLTAQT